MQLVEAEAPANYLIVHEKDRIIRVRKQDVPLSVLPPETIGPMVYLLTEGVIAREIGSLNERQEKALFILLSEVRRWRQFIEVLEHCSLDGTKVKAMASLERINALLLDTNKTSSIVLLTIWQLIRLPIVHSDWPGPPAMPGARRKC
ncbi:hypothetical protein QMK50_20730 [Pseudomonas sp. P5_152]|uniref:hypothetical protein n=1 Tax=Pseudomonas sp. P5_152 TaxID=3043442 RepID=UPI002A36CA26|nr:hypothetical protein [Pseudomonas sp. P5_152]MDX9667388.1 hypothetical protein [Pseudomonas sp. P5_152]